MIMKGYGEMTEMKWARKKKGLSLILSFVLLFTVLCSCPVLAADEPKPDPSKLDKVQELTLNIYMEPSTLDWQRCSSSSETQLYAWLMEGLTRSAGSGRVKPGIAKTWDVSTDGLTWTFHLRDAQWSDGKPVTAQDFVYGAFRGLDPKDQKDYAFFLYDIKGAQAYNEGRGEAEKVGIKAVDEKTVQFTLNTPIPYFEFLVSNAIFAPVRKDMVEKYGDQYQTDAASFVTNGPFQMKSWKHNEEIIFEKNKSYWDAASIYLTKITGLMIESDSDELGLFETGKLDATIAAPSESVGKIGKYSDGSVWYMEFNCKNKILKNKNIRRALGLAIDRKDFIDNVAGNYWTPAMAFVQPDVIPDWDGSNFRDKVPAFFKDNDVATAKECLKKGLKELKLKKLPKLTLMVNDAEAAQEYGLAFTKMWKDKLGISASIEPVGTADRLKRQHAGKYEISIAGWGPDYPDPMTDLSIYVTGGSSNEPGYSNKEYDRLIKAANQETDKQKRSEMLHEAEKILMEDMPIAPLYYRLRAYGVQSYVKNFNRDSFAPDMNPIYAWIEGKPAQ